MPKKEIVKSILHKGNGYRLRPGHVAGDAFRPSWDSFYWICTCYRKERLGMIPEAETSFSFILLETACLQSVESWFIINFTKLWTVFHNYYFFLSNDGKFCFKTIRDYANEWSCPGQPGFWQAGQGKPGSSTDYRRLSGPGKPVVTEDANREERNEAAKWTDICCLQKSTDPAGFRCDAVSRCAECQCRNDCL